MVRAPIPTERPIAKSLPTVGTGAAGLKNAAPIGAGLAPQTVDLSGLLADCDSAAELLCFPRETTFPSLLKSRRPDQFLRSEAQTSQDAEPPYAS